MLLLHIDLCILNYHNAKPNKILHKLLFLSGASYQQLKPSEIKVLPDVSAKDVLRKNSAGIITLIVDPTKLGNDLVEENLVAAHIVRELITLLGVTNYEKSTRLVNEVSRSLSVKNDPQILLKFLTVLQKQGNPTLNDRVDNILKEIGKSYQ